MDYERGLSTQLLAGLLEISSIHIYVITSPQQLAWRVPTVICNIDGHSLRQLAERLGNQCFL